MYDPSLPPGHIEVRDNNVFVNTPPIVISGFDGGEYADYIGAGLHFDYRPLAFYFETGKLRIGF